MFAKSIALVRMPSTLVALLLLAGCATVSSGILRDIEHPLAGRLWDVTANQFIDETELMRRAAQAEVLLLGETHGAGSGVT
jgi:hypothetical protein